MSGSSTGWLESEQCAHLMASVENASMLRTHYLWHVALSTRERFHHLHPINAEDRLNAVAEMGISPKCEVVACRGHPQVWRETTHSGSRYPGRAGFAGTAIAAAADACSLVSPSLPEVLRRSEIRGISGYQDSNDNGAPTVLHRRWGSVRRSPVTPRPTPNERAARPPAPCPPTWRNPLLAWNPGLPWCPSCWAK